MFAMLNLHTCDITNDCSEKSIAANAEKQKQRKKRQLLNFFVFLLLGNGKRNPSTPQLR
jgi:hypothetical protein